MNPNQLVERTSKALSLKVFKCDNEGYFVENSTGDVYYKVMLHDGFKSCTCPDFQRHTNNDPDFRCKHVIAALNSKGGDVQQIKHIERHRPKLDRQFITQFQGKDFVLYSGLLDLAHQKGIRRLNVDVEQFPTSDNDFVAICRASVESVTGEEYIEWGDANPKNVNGKVAAHILRMAATRAKARALRDFTNIGMTCMEELGGTEDVEAPTVKEKPKPKEVVKLVTKSEEPDKPVTKPNVTVKPASGPIPFNKKQMTDQPSLAQLKAIENLAGRRGINTEMLEDIAKEQFGSSYKLLSPSDASTFIRYLQKSA
jgi:hypothetical protein